MIWHIDAGAKQGKSSSKCAQCGCISTDMSIFFSIDFHKYYPFLNQMRPIIINKKVNLFLNKNEIIV